MKLPFFTFFFLLLALLLALFSSVANSMFESRCCSLLHTRINERTLLSQHLCEYHTIQIEIRTINHFMCNVFLLSHGSLRKADMLRVPLWIVVRRSNTKLCCLALVASVSKAKIDRNATVRYKVPT